MCSADRKFESSSWKIENWNLNLTVYDFSFEQWVLELNFTLSLIQNGCFSDFLKMWKFKFEFLLFITFISDIEFFNWIPQIDFDSECQVLRGLQFLKKWQSFVFILHARRIFQRQFVASVSVFLVARSPAKLWLTSIETLMRLNQCRTFRVHADLELPGQKRTLQLFRRP